MNDVSVIIPAGGTGKRMGTHIPKPLIEIKGKPLLLYTVEKFLSFQEVKEIIIVLKEEYKERFKYLKDRFYKIKFASAGSTRQQSVLNGFKETQGEIILIHDAARICISKEDIQKCIKHAREKGACVAGCFSSDTVKVVKQGKVFKTLERENIFLVQTPQVFRRNIFQKAIENIGEENVEATDDSFLVERIGAPVYIVETSRLNIKITFPEDIFLAEAILKAQNVI